MPLIETDYHQKYSAQGYRVFAIHVGDKLSNAIYSQQATQITFPTVVDYDNRLLNKYSRVGEASVIFPLAYLIDKNGVVQKIYMDSEPSHATLTADVTSLL